jgi:hypothetical protein
MFLRFERSGAAIPILVPRVPTPPDSRVSWLHPSVLNINFALCCPIEWQGSTEVEIPVAPEIDGESRR